MKDTFVRISTDSGGIAEIFLSELDVLVDEYIKDLDEETKYKPSTFLGVLKYVYTEKFKPISGRRYNSKSMILDAEDISNLWDWYCSLAYRFSRTPTIAQFGILCGIDRHSFADWKNKISRGASPEYCATAKKMFAEAEAALEAKAVESNGIGAIFGLKACHQWRETSPITPTESDMLPVHETAEQIAARYASATLPEKPFFDD